MPTPAGHAIGGLAAALFAYSGSRRPGLLSPALLLAGAAAAVLPDLDLLTGSHRTYTHSVGAVAIVGAMSWLVLRRRLANAPAAAAAIMAAHASHLMLDWLGTDTSRPPGLTILWPFSSEYFVSGFNVFGEVSRRYWLVDEFIFGNIRAVVWEMTLLMPALLIAWIIWSRRTIGDRRSAIGDRPSPIDH